MRCVTFNNVLAGSAIGNVTKLSLASEQMQAAERSQLRRLLSSDDFNHYAVFIAYKINQCWY